LFTVDNLNIQKLTTHKYLVSNSFIITAVFFVPRNSINMSITKQELYYNNKNAYTFFYYPYLNSTFIIYSKLVTLYRFANFVFIYILFIMRKLVISLKKINLSRIFKNKNLN